MGITQGGYIESKVSTISIFNKLGPDDVELKKDNLVFILGSNFEKGYCVDRVLCTIGGTKEYFAKMGREKKYKRSIEGSISASSFLEARVS